MMAKGVLFTLPTMTAMAVVPVHHPGGEVSLGDCESRCDVSLCLLELSLCICV